MSCDNVTTGQENLQLLPHTWLYIPPTPHLQITSYYEHLSTAGTVYTAGLSVNGENVGVLHNDGRGTATSFHSVGNPLFRQDEMRGYVAACRTHLGGFLAEEWVLDELIASATLTSSITQGRRDGLRVIRALDVLGSPDAPRATVILTGGARLITAYDPTKRRELSDRLAAKPLPGVDRWWQEWIEAANDTIPPPGAPAPTGSHERASAQSEAARCGHWQDLTTRPPIVPTTDPPADRPR